ncbi:putative g-patch domain-containing protein [Phaeomoniella chlamydospora]|uniref:Putative g-patch domain-containing protein n=1 Tax=Phaeomoniella chlamydospora TaxID=158046 RepID=A0A0G2GZI9_PHACM|nr:putative g-patch domain-containing protein [Phaeomoniella chlamydospora]
MPSLQSPEPPKTGSTNDEEEDDYLTMNFEDPAATTSRKETLTQARKRKLLHAETAGRPKSKAELAAEEARRREEGLATKLGATADNKGLKMMQKLGYKPGSALGVNREGDRQRLDPIGLSMKEDRSGIGRESEAKRKIRETFEREQGEEKRRKVEEGEFVDRVRQEREEKRKEGQFFGAQKVAEGLEEEEEISEDERRRRKLKNVPVMWRSLVKKREIEERDRRQRHDLYTSLSRRPEFEDPELDESDKLAMGNPKDPGQVFEVDDSELDEDDPELEEFESQDSGTRLDQLVTFLREHWHYCFWCKYRYQNAEMEGCPGLTEEEHG